MSVCSEIIERLKIRAPIFDGRVSIARNINNQEPTTIPEAWVHRWTKVAGQNTTTNFTVQAVTAEIAMLIATAIEGDDGIDHVQVAEQEVLEALIDNTFTVGPTDWPLEYARLEHVEIRDGYQIFRMTFRYQEYVRG